VLEQVAQPADQLRRRSGVDILVGHVVSFSPMHHWTDRRQIYLPSYRWVLDHRLTELVERLRGVRAA
jgi:hypothetical protein